MKKSKLEKLGLEKFIKSDKWLLDFSQRSKITGGYSICVDETGWTAPCDCMDYTKPYYDDIA